MRWPMSPVSAGDELGAFFRRRLPRKPSDATSCEPIAHRRFQILPDSSSCVQMLPDSSPKKLKKIRIPNPPLAVCLWQGAVCNNCRHWLVLLRGLFEPRAAARGRACARAETVRQQNGFSAPANGFSAPAKRIFFARKRIGLRPVDRMGRRAVGRMAVPGPAVRAAQKQTRPQTSPQNAPFRFFFTLLSICVCSPRTDAARALSLSAARGPFLSLFATLSSSIVLSCSPFLRQDAPYSLRLPPMRQTDEDFCASIFHESVED